jgi:hypothetical protein
VIALAEIEEAIAFVGEAAAPPRLRRCLETLHRSLDLWPGPQRCDGSLFVVTASPNSCVVLCASQGWPALDPAVVATIATAEIAAIETAMPEQHGASSSDWGRCSATTASPPRSTMRSGSSPLAARR